MAIMEETLTKEPVVPQTPHAPRIAMLGISKGPGGDIVSRFLFRMVRPNRECLPPAVMHTFEHLLTAYMRDAVDGFIDISPMGCRTGFILTVWGEPAESDIKKALVNSLKRTISTEWGKIPGVSEFECSNYRDHSLYGAKKYSLQILEGLFNK